MVQGHPLAAILLAIYCTIVVSGIDNVIKPLILHGQSKLHPLLALLSILGGVQVLGPVGILVGPMLVSFLQALLTMLRKELDSFGAGKGRPADELASFVEATVGAASEKHAPAIADARATQPASDKGGERDGQGRRPRSRLQAATAIASKGGRSVVARERARRVREHCLSIWLVSLE